MTLEIIYQDEQYVIINKPHGLLVHRTKIAAEASEFAVQILRNQLGKKVFPVHRLDRKTSGVLIFALSAEATKLLAQQFTERTIAKEYWAIVRGFSPQNGTIDKPLKSEKGNLQPSETKFETVATHVLNIPMGKYPTCRYSLVKVSPKTGRMHQIRRHFNYINHPIIGDYRHGDYRHNQLFIREFGQNYMYLHAAKLSFEHPYSDEEVTIEAAFQPPFQHIMKEFGWNYPTV